MGWESYSLDQTAHDLVFKYRNNSDALQQAYKMRSTVAYGLERFWGEQLRLSGEKEKIWTDTWSELCLIMERGGINLPAKDSNPKDLWSFPAQQRKITLAILTQLCDAIVWWTQRYKKNNSKPNGGNND